MESTKRVKRAGKKRGNIRGRLSDGTPNPVDIYVGTRLREARLQRGLSQERVAEEMGITFQQVQKYEKGLNRIGASRLWDLAQVLGMPISYFYDDMDQKAQSKSPRKINSLHDSANSIGPETITPRDMELLRLFKKIRNEAVIAGVFSLVRSLAFSSEAATAYPGLSQTDSMDRMMSEGDDGSHVEFQYNFEARPDLMK